MARMHYRDPTSGEWVPIGTQGPAGPSAVSTDANNTAVLGTDSLIFVPAPTPPVLDHGGLTGLNDDDHPHYFNQARGDARYALTGHSHGATILPADVAPPAIGASSVLGVSADYAREDHTHSGPQASAVTPTADDAAAGVVGVGTAWARSDHKHQVTTAAPVALGAANAAGSASSLARSDHVHIYPTAANVGAATPADVTSAVSTHAGAADPHTGYQRETEKGAVNGYASLDGTGVIPTAQLPPLAVNDVFTPADQTAMLALTAQVGDMAIRADNGRTYVLSAAPASTLSNWKEVMAAGQVQSVNSQTGVVTLTATNIGSTATGSVAATNVQTAIAELASEKADLTAIPALASTTPPALTPDIAAAVGVGTTTARADHVHNVPAAAPITPLTAATSDAEGTGASFSRNDHTHSITTAAPVALGGANAAGTAAGLARADHVHIYPTAAQVGAATSGDLTTHAGAADPHTGYQKESEKGAVSGYAALDGTGKVPVAQLPAMGVSDHGALTGLLNNDHTQYQLLTEKGAVNGYASLGADGKVPAEQVGIVATPPEVGIQDAPPPAPAEVVLWVDPNDFQGDSGWQGFDARYVNVIGDAMTGPLAMGSQKITGLAAATAAGDAMSQSASDARYLAKTGGTMSGPIAMGSQKITGLAAPTVAGDAADKTYVDNKISTATISASAPASPVVGQLWATP